MTLLSVSVAAVFGFVSRLSAGAAVFDFLLFFGGWSVAPDDPVEVLVCGLHETQQNW